MLFTVAMFSDQLFMVLTETSTIDRMNADLDQPQRQQRTCGQICRSFSLKSLWPKPTQATPEEFLDYLL